MSIIGRKKILLKQSIPVVSHQTLEAVYESYAGNKWGIHLAELREDLLRDNPNLGPTEKFLSHVIRDRSRRIWPAGALGIILRQLIIGRPLVKFIESQVGKYPREMTQCHI